MEYSKNKTFEISLVVKDVHGNPTRQRKSLASDDANAIAEFYWKYQGKPKRKKKSTKAAISELPKKGEAEKLMKKVADYAEKKIEKRSNPN